MAHLQALTGLALAACLATASFAVNGQAMGIAPKPSLKGWVPAVENLPGGGWRVIPNVHMRVRDQQVADAILRRIWSTEGGKIVVKDGIKIAGRAGELIVQAAKRLTPAQAAAAVARCFANPVCVAAAAAAGISVALWDHYRIRPTPDGGLEHDEGQVQSEQQMFFCGMISESAYASSASGACNAAIAKEAAKRNRSVKDWRGCTETTTVVNRGLVEQPDWYEMSILTSYSGPQGCSAPTSEANQRGRATATTVTVCPPMVDFSDPRYSVPGGPPGADGKCPTGRYAPVSVEQAVQKYEAHPGSLEELLEALRGAIDHGNQESPAAQDLIGPESQTGTPESSTTTGPQGTSTTTKTPVYNYTYGGDTITYTTTYNTQTCTGANSCTTTTTTPPKPTEQDPEDPCTASPDRAGCAKLGTPPNPEDLKKKDVPVSITPESGFGSGTGTCPGPIQLRNGATVDPFGLVCTYMSGIRFAVIGVAWLMAALIFLGRVD